jgi:hypothetical protein
MKKEKREYYNPVAQCSLAHGLSCWACAYMFAGSNAAQVRSILLFSVVTMLQINFVSCLLFGKSIITDSACIKFLG